MAGYYKKVLAVMFLLSVSAPLLGAGWTVDEAHFFPQYASERAEAVLTAQAVDRNGEVISPSWCNEQSDFIKFRYDYDDDQTSVPMEYADSPYGWYFDDSLQVNQSDSDLRVFANGLCRGVNGQDSMTVDLPLRGQAVDGDFLVDVVEGMKEEYWEEETEQFYWNVSRTVQFGTEFVEHANLSYRLYYQNRSLISTGRMDRYSYRGVQRGDKNYSAEVDMPKGAGKYILGVIALNNSYQGVDNPYGGVAKTIDVRPTYLRGTGNIHMPEEKCRMMENPTCEKGTTIDISFSEEYADASYVNVTIKGSRQNTYEFYDRFNIRQWNSSYWNGSFTIPENYDTGTYGKELSFEIQAVHKYTRDGEVEKSKDVTTKRVNVTSFKVLESTPPFVKLGNVIPITFSPVTPYTENPVPVDTFSEARIEVVNGSQHSIYSRTISFPFRDSYDDESEIFTHDFKAPFNASTGVHTAHITMRNVYGETVTQSFTFKILDSEESGRPVVVVAAGGNVNNKNITKTYDVAKKEQENILLRNLGSSAATVDMSFTGDLKDIATSDERTVSIPKDQQHMFRTNLTFRESGTYEGTVEFLVTGSTIQPYNLSVPVVLEVQCKHVMDVFCIQATNLDREVTSSGTYNMTLTVKNEGQFRESFDITADGQIADFIGQTPQSYGITAGNTSLIQIPFTVETYDSGYYNGSVILSTFSTTMNLNSSIDVAIDKGQIDVSAIEQDLGQFVEGDVVSVQIRVNNSGTRDIQTIRVTSDKLGISTESEPNLAPQEATELSYDGSAPSISASDNSQQITSTITVTPNTGSPKSVDVSMKVFPDYSQRIQSKLENVERLQAELKNKTGSGKSTVASNLERVNIQLENAMQDWEKGYYGAAERKFLEAKTGEREAEAAFNQLESPDTGDGKSPVAPFILPMAIILVLFAISGIILYLSIVPEDEVR